VVAVFLIAGVAPQQAYRSYNVGGPTALSLSDIARIASKLGGCPEPILRPFPADRKPIDIGSYRTDHRRILRELRWVPEVSFEEGLQHTLDFYRAHLDHYLPRDQANPVCRMPEHTEGPGRLTYAVSQ
jgi:UDP-glucose 4-epimerase